MPPETISSVRRLLVPSWFVRLQLVSYASIRLKFNCRFCPDSHSQGRLCPAHQWGTCLVPFCFRRGDDMSEVAALGLACRCPYPRSTCCGVDIRLPSPS